MKPSVCLLAALAPELGAPTDPNRGGICRGLRVESGLTIPIVLVSYHPKPKLAMGFRKLPAIRETFPQVQ
jgi:hypothetical protein